MALCSECTYLGNSYNDGTFYCDAKLECVYAYQQECDRFCRAYNRPSSVAASYEQYSRNKAGYYITTMICKILKMSDNNPFLTSIKFLRNNVMEKDEKYKGLLQEYDVIGPVIANNLISDPLKYQIAVNNFFKYIKPISKLVREKEYDKAISSYKQMTDNLKTFYNINTTLESTINNNSIVNPENGICKVKKITY